MEKRDLYDINRNLIGKSIFKNEPISENTYIMMVVIFIQNDNNKFLIQKRSIDKGGKWATTGGHPKSGESSLEEIISEVKEELGIILFYLNKLMEKIQFVIYIALEKILILKTLKFNKKKLIMLNGLL